MERRAHDVADQRCERTAGAGGHREHRQEQLAIAGIEAAVLERDRHGGDSLSILVR